jgi:hypothetical protein
MSIATEIEAAERVLRGETVESYSVLPKKDPSLPAAVHRVMNTPQCAITGEAIDAKQTFIHTPIVDEGTLHKLTKTIEMNISPKGLHKIIESLIAVAHTRGPMSAEQMVAHIYDMRVADMGKGYYNNGKYESVSEYRNKHYATDKEKPRQDQLFCPFCKHTMKDHLTHGGAASLERTIRCSTCGCDDTAHPALISLKDQAQIMSGTIGN